MSIKQCFLSDRKPMSLENCPALWFPFYSLLPLSTGWMTPPSLLQALSSHQLSREGDLPVRTWVGMQNCLHCTGFYYLKPTRELSLDFIREQSLQNLKDQLPVLCSLPQPNGQARKLIKEHINMSMLCLHTHTCTHTEIYAHTHNC